MPRVEILSPRQMAFLEFARTESSAGPIKSLTEAVLRCLEADPTGHL